jgi:hypothetical protein
MTSLPERAPKKATVPPIVPLLSNGCKQAFLLVTVDLQHARHTRQRLGRDVTAVTNTHATI